MTFPKIPLNWKTHTFQAVSTPVPIQSLPFCLPPACSKLLGTCHLQLHHHSLMFLLLSPAIPTVSSGSSGILPYCWGSDTCPSVLGSAWFLGFYLPFFRLLSYQSFCSSSVTLKNIWIFWTLLQCPLCWSLGSLLDSVKERKQNSTISLKRSIM